jgi:hypothetical protein
MPSYGAAVTQAKGKKPPKVLESLRIKEAENGGHVIEHHFTSYEHEPESHVFAASEGAAAMAHIAKHANIQHDSGKATEEHEAKMAEGSDKEEINA